MHTSRIDFHGKALSASMESLTLHLKTMELFLLFFKQNYKINNISAITNFIHGTPLVNNMLFFFNTHLNC